MPDPDVPDVAVDLAVAFEQSGGFARHPYFDPSGHATIGYGSIWDWRGTPPTRVTMATPPIDEPEARDWMRRELMQAAAAVAADVHAPITENMRAALEDFIFNLGTGTFARSDVLAKLNAGDYLGAADAIDAYDHAGGVVLAGLVRRRAAEHALFRTPPQPDPVTGEMPTGT